MHFICSTFGSSGDVYPLLGLALELRQRGHEVTFATNAHFASLIRNFDLRFEPLGTEEDYNACIRNPNLWHPQRAFKHVFESLKSVLRRQYEIHADQASREQVVGITNCFGFGALLAQEKLGLPVITLQLQPAVLWSDYEPPTLPGLFGPRWLKSLLYRIGVRFVIDPTVCPFLNQWRQELGLPPVRHITNWWNSPTGVLCMFPYWFAPPQPDWPLNTMQTDFPLWNRPVKDGLTADLQQFLAAGTPTLVFTPGSANVHGKSFFQAAIQACNQLERRGILLSEFSEQIPANLPSSVIHLPYVPLDLLLPKAGAFIHHGGVGSTSQGFLAGIPQVIMPLAHDQFDNAERVKRLGVGDWIHAKRFTGGNLFRSLKKLLASHEVTIACKRVAEKLVARNGIARSADAILQLANNALNKR